MRVLLSAFDCQPGGGSEGGKSWAWADALAREHDVTLLTDSSFRPALDPAVERHPGRLRVHYVGDGPPGYEGWDIYPYYYRWQRQALVAARALHAEARFDVAHHISYGMHRVPSYLHQLGIPFIWGPVGGGEGVPLSFYHPRWVGGRGMVDELVRAAWNRWCRIDPRLRACAMGATVPVATTTETLEALPRGAQRRAVVLRNSVVSAEDLEVLADHRAQPGPTSGLRCLFVGRLLGWKGPLLAVSAFASYAATHPDARLDLFGDGPLRSRVEGLAAEHGLTDRITIHSRIPRQELLRTYGRHHAFLFPSMHDSGGTVAGEALAAGLPAVCLDAGGVGAYVPADAGVKVAPTEPRAAVQALADGLAALTQDPTRWQDASDAAFAHARSTEVDPPIDVRIRLLYGRAGVLG